RTADFMNEFSRALSLFDAVYLLPIYAAREEPLDDVSSDLLVKKINKPSRVISKTEVLDVLPTQELDLLITMGAGDISELVEPLKEKLCQTVLV
ncbi:MAG: UDP-N-acetylmuramate--L-alanine ligase, partial [Flavobacteriaceae bacterium]